MQLQIFSQMLIVVGVVSMHLGQSWWHRIQTLGMSEDYKDKNSAIYKWLVLFFGLSLLPSDEVGTAFTNEK